MQAIGLKTREFITCGKLSFFSLLIACGIDLKVRYDRANWVRFLSWPFRWE